mmetsp:Transcript_2329/g.8297  ORF Transcript_2329/g.8297 Transcript_2329/m.8297 type:complete len:212 (-) Transcript_2329:95-730(-)
MKIFSSLTPIFNAFTFAGPSSSPWPKSAVNVTTSHPYVSCNHLRMMEVSNPPEYARTTFFTSPDGPTFPAIGTNFLFKRLLLLLLLLFALMFLLMLLMLKDDEEEGDDDDDDKEPIDILNSKEMIEYLSYLQYWYRDPRYSKYILYPHCLYFLKLLQTDEFRKAMRNPRRVEEVHVAQFTFWAEDLTERVRKVMTTTTATNDDGIEESKKK